MKRSLQFTLSLGLGLSLLLVFFVLWVVVNNAIRVVAEQYIEARLEHDAESLLIATSLSKKGQWEIDLGKLSVNFSRPFSGHYYLLTIGKKKLWSRSLWDLDLSIIDGPLERTSTTFVSGPQDQNLLVIGRQYTKQGQSIHIRVAEDFSPIERDIQSLRTTLSLTALVFLLLLILLQVALLKISLRPLKKTSDELLLLERGELQQLSLHVPREINPMVVEINRLFTAMNLRLRRSRNAIGDLSHSLKKPLTVLQQLVTEKDALSNPESKEIFNSQVSSINNIIGRNLKRARLAGDGPGGAHFIISKDVNELVETIRMIYPEVTVMARNQSSDVDVLSYDRDDILELLGNIIDNAAKWTKDTVQVTIKYPAEGDIAANKKTYVNFIVEDNGPGIPEDKITDMLQRGSRLDEVLEGQGMGLAIVHDIVLEYSGLLDLTRSEDLGGLKVNIKLPL